MIIIARLSCAVNRNIAQASANILASDIILLFGINRATPHNSPSASSGKSALAELCGIALVDCDSHWQAENIPRRESEFVFEAALQLALRVCFKNTLS